jgi:hypothetical protein
MYSSNDIEVVARLLGLEAWQLSGAVVVKEPPKSVTVYYGQACTTFTWAEYEAALGQVHSGGVRVGPSEFKAEL